MIAEYILTFLVFILPLIVSPIGPFAFEAPKVILAEFGIELFLITSLFSNTLNFKKIDPKILILSSIYTLFLIVSIFTRSNLNTFFGNAFRLQGPFLTLHLLLFSLFAKHVKIKLNLYLISLVTFLSLFISTFMMGTNKAGEYVGTLGEPNALAAVMLVIFCFIYFKASLIIKFTAVVIELVVIYLTSSYSALLGLSLVITFSLLIKKLNLQNTLVICLFLLLTSYSFPFLSPPKKFEYRAEVWQTAFYSGLSSPIIGHGFGQIENSLKKTSFELNNNLRYQRVDSSHNFILDLWVEGGLIAVAVMLLLIAMSFKNLVISDKKFEIAALLAILAPISFNPATVCILVAFYFFLSQGFSEIDKTS